MSLTRTLTTALAILALGAITAGCAGANVGLSFGPNRPMMQTDVPAEEPDDVEVADVPWDRCDGECRYRESMRICSTTVQVAGAQRQQAHAAFMRFGDRVSFRARVMQSCAGGQRFAQHGPAMRGGHRGSPKCPSGQTFRLQYGKCVGGVLHDVPLSEERRQYYIGCPKIETRLVVRGGRLEKQQRCAPQETRARS